jgi:hypothetical protein
MAPHSQSKYSARCSAPAPVSLEEETFDFNNISDPLKDKDEDAPVPAKSQAVCPPKLQAVPAKACARGSNALGDETICVVPIIRLVVKSNRALDIDLIFNCGKGKPSECKYCK